MRELRKAFENAKKAKIAYRQAKRELAETLLVAIDENGGEAFARDIATSIGVPTREVIGALQSAMCNGDLDARREQVEVTYVALLPNGEVNHDDKFIKKYMANKYYLR